MPDPKLADAIHLTKCDCGCGQIGLSFIDRHGRVFAVALFDEERAETLADDLLDLIDEEGDAIGEVVGHA